MNKQELIEKLKTIDGGYGSRCYIAMNDVFELVEQLDEPQEVTVPQFVADWYEECKDNLEYNLWSYIYNWGTKEECDFKNWLDLGRNNPIQTLINMHQFGYEVEKEKRYIVKFKNVQSGSRYFKYDGVIGKWYFGINQDSNTTRLCHTKEELEEAGFGEVFNSPLFEVEEVE